jgi:hypothetical protein
VKRFSALLTVLLLSIVILVPTSVLAGRCEPMATIEKSPYCMKPYNPAGDTFSSNYPYYTGMKYYWWINITVHAETDLENVAVYDRLGGEFMINGICLDVPIQPSDLPDYTPGPTVPPEVNGEFSFSFWYDTVKYGNPVRDGNVVVAGPGYTNPQTGTVNADGVTFGEFYIYWTGNSCKAHFQWNIGPMDEGDTRTIYLVISTDLNPAGHQEFTSTGITYLNSGATLKVLTLNPHDRWVPIYSTSTPPIPIEVIED